MRAARRYSVRMLAVAPYWGRISSTVATVSGSRGWWSMMKMGAPQIGVVGRLRIHDGPAVVMAHVHLLQGQDRNAQQPHHELVLGGDGPDVGDGDVGQAAPEQAPGFL